MPNNVLLIIGGPDISLKSELLKLIKSNYRLIILGSNQNDIDGLREKGFTAEYYYLNRNFSVISDFQSFIQLHRMIKIIKPYIVHTLADSKPAIIGRLAALSLRVPIVVGTLTGLVSHLYSDNYKISLISSLQKFIFESLLILIRVLGGFTIIQNKDDYQLLKCKSILKSNNSLIIPGSGVDSVKYSKSNVNLKKKRKLIRELGISDETLVITCIARLIRSKGIIELLKVAKAIKPNYKKVKFLLVGPHDDSHDSISTKELKDLQDSMMWLGHRSDIVEILSISNIFVFPQLYREGFPRVLLEAGLMKLPIITSNVPGCRELIKDGKNGLLVDPGDINQLKNAIIILINNSHFRKILGGKVRRDIIDSYDLKIIVKQHIKLYKDLTNKHTNYVYL